MKKIFTLLFFIFLGSNLPAQNVNFDWAAHFGGFNYEMPNLVTLDASGNVYSTGWFGATVDFDPGPGVFSITTINGAGFVSKLDKNRNFIWAKHFEGTLVRSKSVKVDASGNVIIIGSYYLDIDLDPGPAIVSGSSTNMFFVIKLDAAGNFILGKTFGHIDDPNSKCNLALDASGNIYISGIYDYLSDFDPGPATYTLPIVGFNDIFILKLDQNANFIWAKGVGSTAMYRDESNAIAIDANGNVLITGIFGFVCDFDPGPGVFTITSPGVTPYILKLNTNGGFVWAKHFEVLVANADGYGRGIAVDQSGNVFVGGSFSWGALDFDPGPGVYPISTYNQYYDAFLCKLDVSGNFLWAKNLTGFFHESIDAVTLDAGGNVYATGIYYNTVDFDPGAGINNLTSAGQSDVFIMKLNTQGNFEWAKSVGGGAVDQPVSIIVDATGSVYTLGSFENTADMDPDVGVVDLVGLGFKDIFLLKLSRCTNNTFHTISASVCNNYILNNQIYTSSGIYTQVIPNASGCDSTITLNLTINRKINSVNATICEGQTYYAGGANQTTAGIYKDTLLTSLGCDSVIITDLKVHPKPRPDLGPDGNICMDTQSSITPGSFSSYLWQDNSSQPDYIVTSIGKYWVTVIDANNCSATDTLNILTIDTIPKNFLPTNRQLCNGDVLKITVPNYSAYQWSTGSTISTIDISSFGTYYLTVKDFNNCIGTDSITIQRKNCIYIAIPNAFTPNDDTKNDIFKPIINQAIQNFSFIVFNRYGQKVFETREYGKGWDGTLKGKPQPSGSYVYNIKYTNIFGIETVENGSVLLIR